MHTIIVSMDHPVRTCAVCGKPLDPGRRSTARYCEGYRCRKAAQRLGIADSKTAPVEFTKILPSAVPKRQRKPAIEDMTRLVMDAVALEASFRFASLKADYRFRPMCSRIADAIESALEQEGLL